MTFLSRICATACAAMACLVMGSCFSDSDSDNTHTSGHCAITTAALGNLTRTVYVKNSNGVDTSYQVALAGAAYPLYIDQLRQEIYNPDSLPMNTHVDKVLFSAINGDGVIGYITPYGNDTLFNAKDTIDCSVPVIFTCHSSDGNQQKNYRLTVNVHKMASEAFTWAKVCEMPDAFAGVSAQKAFLLDSTIVIVGLKNGQPWWASCPMSDPAAWQSGELANMNGLDVAGVQKLGDSLYATADAGVMVSANGRTWRNVGGEMEPQHLVGASKSELYGFRDGKIWNSTDGITWQCDSADSDLALFPSQATASTWLQMNFNMAFSYALIGGRISSDDGTYTPVVWKKTIDSRGNNTEPWTLYAQNEGGPNTYPTNGGMVMLNYDEKVYALCLEGDTLSNFYFSSDAGRNWVEQSSTSYLHPRALQAENFSAVVDSDNYIWIILAPSGTVWRGRLNRLSFAEHQTIFTKGAAPQMQSK